MHGEKLESFKVRRDVVLYIGIRRVCSKSKGGISKVPRECFEGENICKNTILIIT